MKISIAGAKLSHLVQKDKIWDHGSMAEQAKIIFYLVQKGVINGNIDSLEKYMTISCFKKLKSGMMQMENHNKFLDIQEPVIKELAVIEVCPAKYNRPDSFTAIIKGDGKNKNVAVVSDLSNQFSARWSFVRYGDWWLLNEMKTKISFLKKYKTSL